MAARRPARLIAAALLAAAGCADDGDGGAGADPGEPAVVTLAPGSPPPAEPATTAGGPTSAVPSAPPSPSTASTTPTGSGDGEPLDLDVPAGGFAAAYLRPSASERIVVEVHADAAPRAGTLDHLAAVLGEVTGKPVSVATGDGPGGGARDWTAAELVAAADRVAVTEQGGGVAVVRLLFVRGTFEGDRGVLGVAVRGDVAAVFTDRVAAAGGLLGASGPVERAVTLHEVGHLLGLVDLVLATGRADPEHPGHSSNPGSVMYWAVESSLVGQLLGAAPPDRFDADDLADLRAIASG